MIKQLLSRIYMHLRENVPLYGTVKAVIGGTVACLIPTEAYMRQALVILGMSLLFVMLKSLTRLLTKYRFPILRIFVKWLGFPGDIISTSIAGFFLAGCITGITLDYSPAVVISGGLSVLFRSMALEKREPAQDSTL